MFVLRVDHRPVSFAWVTESMTFSIGELDACVMIDRPMVWNLGLCDPGYLPWAGVLPAPFTSADRAVRSRPDSNLLPTKEDSVPAIRGIQKAGFAPWMSVAATHWRIRIQRNGDVTGGFRVMRQVPRSH